MPKVSVNNDPLLERLVFAYDGTSYRVVTCDTDGNVVAALKTGQSVEVTQDTAADLLATVNIAAAQTIAVTQATPANLQAAVNLNTDQNVQARRYGWIASAWQKAPLPFGYSGVGAETVSKLNAAASFDAIAGTSVPAGEFWIVSAADAYDANTAVSRIGIVASVAGVSVYLISAASPGAGIPLAWSGQAVLGPGDNVLAAFFGTVLNDDLYLHYCYTRVDIDQ